MRQMLFACAALAALSAPAFANPAADLLAVQARPATSSTQIAEAMRPAGAAPAMAPQVLASIARPPQEIANAAVRDLSGKLVGAVQRVELTSNGNPAALDIAPLKDQTHMLQISASAASYDPQTNVIVADLSQAMPYRPKG